MSGSKDGFSVSCNMVLHMPAMHETRWLRFSWLPLTNALASFLAQQRSRPEQICCMYFSLGLQTWCFMLAHLHDEEHTEAFGLVLPACIKEFGWTDIVHRHSPVMHMLN